MLIERVDRSYLPILRGWTGGISQDQFRANLVFLALRVGGTEEFVKGVGCHASQQLPVYVYRGERRITVFGQTRFIEAGDRDVLRDAKPGVQQALDHSDGSEIVDGHHGGWPGGQLGDR